MCLDSEMPELKAWFVQQIIGSHLPFPDSGRFVLVRLYGTTKRRPGQTQVRPSMLMLLAIVQEHHVMTWLRSRLARSAITQNERQVNCGEQFIARGIVLPALSCTTTFPALSTAWTKNLEFVLTGKLPDHFSPLLVKLAVLQTDRKSTRLNSSHS